MSDYSDFITTIAEWANRQDWSPQLVGSFVRDAEAKLNSELRIDRMIQFDESEITQRNVALPDDWLEMDLVLIQDPTLNSGWRPLRYMYRDQFFRFPDAPYMGSGDNWQSTVGRYTIEGRQIYIGGPPQDISTNGNIVRIAYYGEVPVFSDTVDSWVYTKFPSLYRYAALMHADLHAVGEEDAAGLMKQLAEDAINKLNANHQHARASGSLLTRRPMRSFG